MRRCLMCYPKGPRIQNGALGPKYHNMNGFGDLKPHDLSPWTLRVKFALSPHMPYEPSVGNACDGSRTQKPLL